MRRQKTRSRTYAEMMHPERDELVLIQGSLRLRTVACWYAVTTPSMHVLTFYQTTVHNLIKHLGNAHSNEVGAVSSGFLAFSCVLGSYFLLVPLREEAAVTLGTSKLPQLFAASLVVTLIAAPLTSALLTRRTSRKGANHELLCRAMALVLLGFYVAMSLAQPPILKDNIPATSDSSAHSLDSPPGIGSVARSLTWIDPADSHFPGRQRHRAQESPQEVLAELDINSSGSVSIGSSGNGSKSSSGSSRHLRNGDRGTNHRLRPDGIIHTSHSSISQDLVLNTDLSAQGMAEGSWDTAPIPLAPVLQTSPEVGHSIDRSIPNSRRRRMLSGSSSSSSSSGGSSSSHGSSSTGGSGWKMTRVQTWIFTIFYVSLNAQNLVLTSALWALAADVFSPESGMRVFGFLSAGATFGQLMSSLTAVGYSQVHAAWFGTSAPPPLALLPMAALLLLIAGRCCIAMASHSHLLVAGATAQLHVGLPTEGKVHVESDKPGVTTLLQQKQLQQPYGLNSRLHQRQHPGDGQESPTVPYQVPVRQSGWGLLEGFRLIGSSWFLLLLCIFLMLNYVVSSIVYFERALVISTQLNSSSQRTAFFALINGCSAAMVFVLQLLATGRMVASLGVSTALCVSPLLSAAGFLVIALHPRPHVVAGVEVIRKVVQYSLARPTREMLFTVLSREEKYSAKITLDTVVQRLGDAAAAALFEVVGVQYAMGPVAMAVSGLGLCGVWLGVTLQLGVQYRKRRGGLVSVQSAMENSAHLLV